MENFFDREFFRNFTSNLLADLVAASIGIYIIRLLIKKFFKSEKFKNIIRYIKTGTEELEEQIFSSAKKKKKKRK